MREGSERFGEVRALLQEAPSEAAWTRLCALLEGCERDALTEEILPYCAQHLQRWPDALRVVRRPEVERLVGGQPVNHWTLARALDVAEMRKIASFFDGLAERDALSELRQVSFSNCQMGPEALRRLMALLPSQTLTHLDLSYNAMGEQGAAVLAEVEAFPRLEVLNLRRNKIKAKGAAALHVVPLFSTLRELDLGYNALGKTHAATIFSSELWPSQLELLDLCYANVSDRAVEVLVNSPRAASLRALNLRQCDVSDVGLSAMVSSTQLGALRFLGLEGNDLRRYDRFWEASWFEQLELLDLRSMRHDNDTAELRAFIAEVRQRKELDGLTIIDRYDRSVDQLPFPWKTSPSTLEY